MLSNLPAPVLAVLAKATSSAASDARSALDVGQHDVDTILTIAVSGRVIVGADYQQRIVLKADPFAILAAALSHLNGVTVASIVREALAADPALIDSIKTEALAAWKELADTTVTECAGKVTHKGTTATLVSVEETQLAAK